MGKDLHKDKIRTDNVLKQFSVLKELGENDILIYNESIFSKARRYLKLKSPKLNEFILKYRKYDKNWPLLYKKEKTKILKASKNVLKCAHLGSTSILNLGSNNIIDIGLIVKEKNDIEKCKIELKRIGYESYGNSPLSRDAEWLWKSNNHIAYVIHIDDVTNPWFEDTVLLCDYLCWNKNAFNAYKSAKKEIFKLKKNNLLLYSLKKIKIINDIINKAKQRSESRYM